LATAEVGTGRSASAGEQRRLGVVARPYWGTPCRCGIGCRCLDRRGNRQLRRARGEVGARCRSHSIRTSPTSTRTLGPRPTRHHATGARGDRHLSTRARAVCAVALSVREPGPVPPAFPGRLSSAKGRQTRGCSTHCSPSEPRSSIRLPSATWSETSSCRRPRPEDVEEQRQHDRPWEAVREFGAERSACNLRVEPVWLAKRSTARDPGRRGRFFNTLRNAYHFFALYAGAESRRAVDGERAERLLDAGSRAGSSRPSRRSPTRGSAYDATPDRALIDFVSTTSRIGTSGSPDRGSGHRTRGGSGRGGRARVEPRARRANAGAVAAVSRATGSIGARRRSVTWPTSGAATARQEPSSSARWMGSSARS